MGVLLSRSVVLKLLMFACVFGCMMMWRRLQLSSCHETRMINANVQNIRVNSSRTQQQQSPAALSKHFEKLASQNQPGDVWDKKSDINEFIWSKEETLFNIPETVKAEFQATLSMKADNSNTVILSIVDRNLQEFALNFYILSLKKHGLFNHVLICLDEDVKSFLQKYGISCLLFALPNVTTSSNPQSDNLKTTGDFGSNSYYTKTNVKTAFVLEALKSNYHVLISDVDVLFFKNPLSVLTCDGCDLMISMDREYWNSGFVFIKPTRPSILLYTRAWKLYNHYHISHDQSYLNMARKTITQDKLPLSAIELSSKQFPCGHYYFTEAFREFANEPACDECIIAHNNYMGTNAAKRYRFMENLLWMVDIDGYYSNKTAKYLTYENPSYWGSETYGYEMRALQSALFLGMLLERIVILPKFHCCDCKTGKCFSEQYRCSLLHMVDIKLFHEAFSPYYREASFFYHQLVPDKIRSANALHIKITDVNDKHEQLSAKEELRTFQIDNSITSLRENFQAWTESIKDSTVIHLDSLYVNVTNVASEHHVNRFHDLAQNAFKCTGYEQWQVKPFI